MAAEVESKKNADQNIRSDQVIPTQESPPQ
jgi:hypothetical protein